PPSLAGWTRVYDHVLCEAGFLFWCRQLGVPERVAERAAAGWGGDRLVVFKGPAGQAVAILRTVWDTEPDAIEAQAAAAQALARRTAHEAPAKTALLHEWPGAAGARFWTERRGKEVQVVFDAPADLAAALHAELWAPAKEP
ncbi:MAG: hypothetical protein JST92_02475, partial [Deltaproteobacteria bacterium]|nr:hypothetical protein [Deltaproteobacteria bacterium]